MKILRISTLIVTMSFCLILAAFFIAAPPLLAQQKPGAAAYLPSAPAKESDNRITIRTELVSLTVSVTDKDGRQVAGLNRDAFNIYEDGERQEISFFSDRDVPASIGVVFDVSGSMNGEKIGLARTALARFIQTSHPEDEYSFISFNENARLRLERTRDSETLLAQFAGVDPQGNTALYDAVALGVETLARSHYAKRALIVISDGEDNRSRATFNQIKRKLQEADVTIYPILIGRPLPHSNGGVVMDQLASASGGKLFSPKNAEAMSEAFEQIALELRHQYSIGYAISNLNSAGQWHRLKVAIAVPSGSPRLSVRSRKGYYAIAGNLSDQDDEVMRVH